MGKISWIGKAALVLIVSGGMSGVASAANQDVFSTPIYHNGFRVQGGDVDIYGMGISGNVINFAGGGAPQNQPTIYFGQGLSKIKDDGDLRIITDDNLHLDVKDIWTDGILHLQGAGLSGNVLSFAGGGIQKGNSPTIDLNQGGSWIKDDGNLRINTDDTLMLQAPVLTELTGSAMIDKNLMVAGDTNLGNALVVGGATNLLNDLGVWHNMMVAGTSTLSGALYANGGISVDNSAFLVADGTGSVYTNGSLNALGTTNTHGINNVGVINSDTLMTTGAANLASLMVGGNAAIGGSLNVSGPSTVASLTASSFHDLGAGVFDTTVSVAGATTLASTLNVSGTTTTNGVTNSGDIATGTLHASGLATLDSASVTNNATIGGTLGVTGNFAVNTNRFTVDALTGNTLVAGTLDASGATSLGSTLNVIGTTTTNGLTNAGNIGTGTLATSGLATLASASVTGNETIGGTLGVTGNSTLGGALNVTGASTTNGLTNTGNIATGTLSTTGLASLNSSAVATSETVGTTLSVGGTTTLTGALFANGGVDRSSAAPLAIGATNATSVTITPNTTISGTLNVVGATTTSSLANSGNLTSATLGTSGLATLDSVSVTNNATIAGSLGVTGTSNLGAINASGAYTQSGSGINSLSGDTVLTGVGTGLAVTNNATVGGNLGLTGDLAVNSNKFNIIGSNGNTSIAGTLGVTGATSLSSTLGVTGLSTLAGINASGAYTQTGVGANIFNGDVELAGSGLGLTVDNNSLLSGDATILGSTNTNGIANTGALTTDTLTVNSPATLDSLAVTNNATIGGTLAVTGASTFTGTVFANGGLDRSSAAPLAIGATNATAVTITPNTTVGGTLGVTGAVRLSNLSTDGLVHATGSNGTLASTLLVNADVSPVAAIDFSKLAALPNTDLLVGNASNVATAVAMTGDVTIANTGVTTIATGAVDSGKILNGTITNADIAAGAAIVDTKLATISTAGKVSNSATTATNLNTASAIVARDGSGNFVAGTINAALIGNVTGDISGNASGTASNVTGTVAVGNGGTGQTTLGNHSLLVGAAAAPVTSLAAGTDGQILIGQSGADPMFTTVSGDATISTLGVFTIGTGAVNSTKILDDSIMNVDVNSAAGIAYSKLNLVGSVANADLAGSIDDSKLNTIATAGKVADTALSANVTLLGNTATGTGAFVLASSPSLTTPDLGAATATSINGLTINATTGTLALANGSTLATSGANSITLTSTGLTNVTLPTTGTLATTSQVPFVYNSSGTLQTPAHMVTDTTAYTAGTVTVTLSGSAVFVGAYSCTASDNTNDFPVRVTQTSGSSVTFSNGTLAAANDTIHYVCIGN